MDIVKMVITLIVSGNNVFDCIGLGYELLMARYWDNCEVNLELIKGKE
jgi:hypothetical protein